MVIRERMLSRSTLTTTFIYFATQADADEAAKLLLARGWRVVVTPGTDGTNWLALATQPARGDEEIAPLWEELTALASHFGGNYDRWERPPDEDENLKCCPPAAGRARSG